MQSPLFIAIDFGSQSIRACLLDNKGNIVVKEVINNFHYLSPQPGFVEQDCQWFYQKLVMVCQNLTASALTKKIDLTRITALGITTMRNTLFNLDINGCGVRNAVVWNDSRVASKVPKLAIYWRLLINVGNIFMPIKNEIKKMQSSAFINYIAQHQPTLWHKTEHLLLLSGYLQQQLTGKLIDSSANIIGYLPFNFKRRHWFGKYAWQQQALAIKPQWLPKLIAPGQTIALLKSGATKDLGLVKQIPVVACAADKACEVLGAGCFKDGQVHISLGSAVTITRVSDKFVSPKTFYPAYPSIISGQFLTEFMLPHGLLLLSTFIELNKSKLMFLVKDKVAGQSIEHLLEMYIKANDLDANGQIFDLSKVNHCEQLQQGFLEPNSTDVFAQYVALLEAIITAIKDYMQRVTKKFNSPITQVVVTGGGANSAWLLQKLANKLNVSIHIPKTEQAGCLGVAITLAVNKGLYSNYQQAVEQMCELDTVYIPSRKNN